MELVTTRRGKGGKEEQVPLFGTVSFVEMGSYDEDQEEEEEEMSNEWTGRRLFGNFLTGCG